MVNIENLKTLFEKQIFYIQNLPPKYKKVLKDYTGHSYLDINILNQNEYKDKIILDEIFENIPPIEKEFIVLRGQTKEPILYGRSYVSTTMDINMAKKFINTRNNCCLLRITIKPGTKVIPLFPFSMFKEELEILLNKTGHLVQFEKPVYIDDVKTYNLIYF
jgi:hypothetical protein